MFKFTIRELLLLTVIAALGVAWWVDRSRLANESSKAVQWRDVATWGEQRVLELEGQAAVRNPSATAPIPPKD